MLTQNFSTKTYSVSDLTCYVKNLLSEDALLQNIWVQGEITQLNYYAKGHQYYFTISDGISNLNCVMYSNAIRYLQFKPHVGQHVFLRGSFTLFPKKGSTIFQTSFMTMDGIGSQKIALEKLTQKLESEGLFKTDHKKPIPIYPKHIGIITSNESAAMWDFVTITRQSNQYSTLSVIPTVMQGNHSPLSVIESIEIAKAHHVDLIVIIRGGGSPDDLSGFNDEGLIRALFKCPIPIITGIGHETDTVLSDYVSDVRAETPSAAAHHIASPFNTITFKINDCINYLENYITRIFEEAKRDIVKGLSLCSPNLNYKINSMYSKIESLSNQLTYSNPLSKLNQGFSIISSSTTKETIRSVNELNVGDIIDIRLKDGTLKSIVKDINNGESK